MATSANQLWRRQNGHAGDDECTGAGGSEKQCSSEHACPAAATRMIATIPGREIDPSNPPPNQRPALSAQRCFT